MICVVELTREAQPTTVRVVGPFSSLQEAVLWLLGDGNIRQGLNPSLDMPFAINQTWYEFKEMEHPFTSG
jgi:hypothetical protein